MPTRDEKVQSFFKEVRSCPLIFLRDGVTINDLEKSETPESILIDIKPIIVRNILQPPINKTKVNMEQFSKMQRQFYKRGYNDILEICNQNLIELDLEK